MRKRENVFKNKCGLWLCTCIDGRNRWVEAFCSCPEHQLQGKNCYKCINRVNYMQVYAKRVKAEIVGWDHYHQNEIRMDRFRAAGGMKGSLHEIYENMRKFENTKGLWINPKMSECLEGKINNVEKYFL